MRNEALVNAVIEQITLDIEAQNLDALSEMLDRILSGNNPEGVLVNYLSDCGMQENLSIEIDGISHINE